MLPSLDLASLRAAFEGGLRPGDVVRGLLARRRAYDDPAVWICRVDDAALQARAEELERQGPEGRPLFGVPFAVKDNIDVAGMPTTAACPAFAREARATAPAVQRLLDAGAILIGKTNLDQFATGLVGTRSPYGAPRNPFDARYIPGGSSSGSAVAVAAGLASFALGTDTAGSGRVPAGFCNLVGVKPTRGLVSTRGVVPACRSLDCVSVFALCCDDGAAILDVIDGFDPQDPFARRHGAASGPIRRLGVPRAEQLQFCGDRDYARLFDQALERFDGVGVEVRAVDFGPLFEAAALLYDGPWVAERWLAAQDLIERDPGALLPVTRSIIERGRDIGAADAFAGLYRLAALRQEAEAILAEVDGLVVPTAPTIWTQAEVADDPIGRNSALGTYTNFVNLLDLAALAVPSGFRADGLPFGVTLIGPAFSDRALLDLGGRLHMGLRMGAGQVPAPAPRPLPEERGRVRLAVCGAHMEGLPLNGELVARGGRLAARTRTAPCYRMYALPGGPPSRPGLVRDDGGSAIEVEVWDLPVEALGSLMQKVPAPLSIGTLALEDGTQVKGFLAEAHAVRDALEITSLGGWRRFLAQGTERHL